MSVTIETMKNKPTTAFKIGAVSRITNIPVDTLRIWERRYQVVVPVRSNNSDRLYKKDDINRLTILKMLVDRGHSIGSIAKLSNEELTERLKIHNQKNNQHKKNNHNSSIKVTVIGDVLPLQLEHYHFNDNSFSFSGLYKNETDFFEDVRVDEIDILIMEYPAIQEDTLEEIDYIFKKSGAQQMILIYGFTNSAAKKKLDKTDFVLIQAPITVEHLHAEIKHLIENAEMYTGRSDDMILNSSAPSRQYSNNELIRLSSASTTIKCECPQHLSSMILRLVQFEVYSTQCENRNMKDAKLHALLGKMTGHARSIMEKALSEVVKAEGLKT